jgi:hypothetical protein
MRQIVVWVSIRAPRYWWQEFDTYKTVLAAQSESTMHTIFEDFRKAEAWFRDEFEVPPLPEVQAAFIRLFKQKGTPENLVRVKQLLPESFLQRRMVAMNLMTVQHIYRQRKNHRLPHWHMFLSELKAQLRTETGLGRTGGVDIWGLVAGE